MLNGVGSLIREWNQIASGIERFTGSSDKMSMTLRECARDLHRECVELQAVIDDMELALETCADPTAGVNVKLVASMALAKLPKQEDRIRLS